MIITTEDSKLHLDFVNLLAFQCGIARADYYIGTQIVDNFTLKVDDAFISRLRNVDENAYQSLMNY